MRKKDCVMFKLSLLSIQTTIVTSSQANFKEIFSLMFCFDVETLKWIVMCRGSTSTVSAFKPSSNLRIVKEGMLEGTLFVHVKGSKGLSIEVQSPLVIHFFML